jgi:hypothetical protein
VRRARIGDGSRGPDAGTAAPKYDKYPTGLVVAIGIGIGVGIDGETDTDAHLTAR